MKFLARNWNFQTSVHGSCLLVEGGRVGVRGRWVGETWPPVRDRVEMRAVSTHLYTPGPHTRGGVCVCIGGGGGVGG